MSDMLIMIKVNEIEVEVFKGIIIFKVVEKVGVIILMFCYYDGLSILVNCWMCLVNINKVFKFLFVCYVIVMDGMEVWIEDEKM